MKKITFLLSFLFLAGCERNPGNLNTVVQGTAFDEASLLEKDQITILDFSADW
jgi:uncharacterized lipoprotein YajG